MRNLSILLLAAASCCWVYSCKKESKNNNVDSTLAAYPNQIVGTWLAVKTHIQAYPQDGGPMFLDTTVAITNAWDNAAWDEVYKKDGNAYKIYYMSGSSQLLPDTNWSYKYTVTGENLMLYQQGGGTIPEPILYLDSTNLELQTTYYSAIANPNWNLPANETFKFIVEVFYKKL